MAFSTWELKSVYTSTVGMLAMTIVAPMAPQSVVYSPWKNRRPSGRVLSSSRVSRIRAVSYTHLDVYKRQPQSSSLS